MPNTPGKIDLFQDDKRSCKRETKIKLNVEGEGKNSYVLVMQHRWLDGILYRTLFTCRPARYMKDLSEKRTPNTRKRVETGMSKKKGTKDAKIRP